MSPVIKVIIGNQVASTSVGFVDSIVRIRATPASIPLNIVIVGTGHQGDVGILSPGANSLIVIANIPMNYVVIGIVQNNSMILCSGYGIPHEVAIGSRENRDSLVTRFPNDIACAGAPIAVRNIDPVISSVIYYIFRHDCIYHENTGISIQPNAISIIFAGHSIKHIAFDRIVPTRRGVRPGARPHLNAHPAILEGVSDDGNIFPLVSPNRLIRQVSEMASDDANIGMENSSGRIVATDSPAIVLHDAPADQDIVARSIVIVTIMREYIRILSKVNLNRLRDSSPGISFHDAVSDNHILTSI